MSKQRNFKRITGYICTLLGLLALSACGKNSGSPNPPAPTGETRQVQLGGQTVTVEVVGGLLMFEGDIELGEVTDFDAGRIGPMSFFHDYDLDAGKARDYRWPGGVVPFVWDANITASDKTVLNEAMGLWMAAVPAIRFVERTSQGDYIRFKRRDGVRDRCSSKPGRQGGEQMVWLMETGPCGKFGMVHELGHALGLIHEQSRGDRDQHVVIHTENIQPERLDNFKMRAAEGLEVGAYDFDSVMHYDPFAFCRRDAMNNCVGPTITTIPPGIAIGQRDHLSAGDIAAVKWLYLRNWIVSDGGQSPWRSFGDSGVKTSEMAAGDFNGDGRADFFRADPNACVWYVSYTQLSGPVIGLGEADPQAIRPPIGVLGTSYAGPWQVLSSGKCESLSSLRFGDFNGDRKTDVFVTSGGVWYVSYGGVDWWVELNSSSIPLSQLAFGDFNADGRTDVFRGNGSTWYVSYGGATAWQYLNTSGYEVPNLGFGDFDGDGRTDVFKANGSTWEVSYGGTSLWTYLNTSSYTLGSLRFGDFNADRKTDVYRANNKDWLVSYGGIGIWTALPGQFKLMPYASVSGFVFADFNGDGFKDVFATIK